MGDKVRNESHGVSVPLVELFVGVVVGFTWRELKGFAGRGGFTEGKRVDKETVGTLSEDLFECPSITNGLLTEFKVSEESVAKHGGGLVIHDHQLAIVVNDCVDLTNPVDVEFFDREFVWVGSIFVAEKKFDGVMKGVVNFDMTNFDFERAFNEGFSVEVVDGDCVVMLEGLEVFIQTCHGVCISPPVRNDGVVDKVLSATLFSNEE